MEAIYLSYAADFLCLKICVILLDWSPWAWGVRFVCSVLVENYELPRNPPSLIVCKYFQICYFLIFTDFLLCFRQQSRSSEEGGKKTAKWWSEAGNSLTVNQIWGKQEIPAGRKFFIFAQRRFQYIYIYGYWLLLTCQKAPSHISFHKL